MTIDPLKYRIFLLFLDISWLLTGSYRLCHEPLFSQKFFNTQEIFSRQKFFNPLKQFNLKKNLPLKNVKVSCTELFSR